jgi:hypothetical protein
MNLEKTPRDSVLTASATETLPANENIPGLAPPPAFQESDRLEDDAAMLRYVYGMLSFGECLEREDWAGPQHVCLPPPSPVEWSR